MKVNPTEMNTPSTFKESIGMFTYDSYLDAFRNWVDKGESSAPRQSHNLSHYTKLNLARTLRLHKTLQLQPDLQKRLQSLHQKQLWLVITEAWCGDSAQNLPYIAEMAKINPGYIDLQIVLRDRNTPLMDRYLTNGARAIPKLIVTDAQSGAELFTWGPRPEPAQNLLLQWKNDPQGLDWNGFEETLHKWYANDKGKTLQAEFLNILSVG